MAKENMDNSQKVIKTNAYFQLLFEKFCYKITSVSKYLYQYWLQ
jgi:hypothetical protein